MAKIVGSCGHTIKGPISVTKFTISSHMIEGSRTFLICASCRSNILKILGYNKPTDFNYAGGSDQPAGERTKESYVRKYRP